ncbi:MAG: hypothetical protein AAGJ46_21830 [Planctomycetota bacterium]
MIRTRTTSLLSTCLAAIALPLGANAATITAADDGLFRTAPSVDSVIAATVAEGIFGDDAESLTQTFQILGADLDLRAIAVEYEYDTNSSAPDPSTVFVTLELFEVADVNATELVVGTTLLTLTGLSFPDQGQDQVEARVNLNSIIPLVANTGTDGYGVRLSGGTNGGSRGFEWVRTGSTDNNVYPNGSAYDNDGEVFGTGGSARDFALALIGVPEPASLTLAVGLLAAGVLGRRQTR